MNDPRMALIHLATKEAITEFLGKVAEISDAASGSKKLKSAVYFHCCSEMLRASLSGLDAALELMGLDDTEEVTARLAGALAHYPDAAASREAWNEIMRGTGIVQTAEPTGEPCSTSTH